MAGRSAVEQYERLSSRELHDLAVRRARHNLDLSFFWHLMDVLPPARSATGGNNITDAGSGEAAEQLRPFYIDYLTRRG